MGATPGPMLVADARPRLDYLDALRGLVMVLMALDHTRDFLAHAPWAATDLTTTTVPLFLTRWVTHLCAPTFICLTGVGAYRDENNFSMALTPMASKDVSDEDVTFATVRRSGDDVIITWEAGGTDRLSYVGESTS